MRQTADRNENKIINLKPLSYLAGFSLIILSLHFSALLPPKIGWLGASGILFCLFALYQHISSKHSLIKLITGLSCVLFSALYAVHFFDSPSWLIIEYRISDNSGPLAVYYNFDKLVLAIIILLCIPQIRQNQINSVNKTRLFAYFMISSLVIFALAMGLKLIAFEPKVLAIEFLIIWSVKNLILVCIGEEVLFRGFIQHELAKWHKTSAWLISSLIFGLAHLPAGFLFSVIATFAGLLYGWIYLKTNNIWLSIVAHFVFNLIHLTLFSYPYLPQ